MKILVTGGAGYIGSYMVRVLLQNRLVPIVLDTLENGHREAIASGAILVQGSIGDRGKLTKLFKDHQIEAVMHFAAYTLVEESMQEPQMYFQNNLLTPLTLLEVMEAFKVNKFIFSSTAAVYGSPVHIPIKEDDPKAPTNTYGLSKWNFEQLLSYYDRNKGIRSISLRYFNAAGADPAGDIGEDHHPETHLIPLACATALGQRPQFLIYGTKYPTSDGSAVRDFIHIADLCQAHLLTLAALSDGHESAVYNVGTGKGFSVKEVVKKVKAVSNIDFPVKEVGPRSGDPHALVASAGKLSKEFGWKPKYSDLETIVATAWRWHRTHPQGYAYRR